MNEKLVAELAARVINEMELNGHSVDSGYREVVNQKWQNGNIPKKFDITHEELRNAVKSKIESVSENSSSDDEENAIDVDKIMGDAIAHEQFHKKRLGDDYE